MIIKLDTTNYRKEWDAKTPSHLLLDGTGRLFLYERLKTEDTYPIQSGGNDNE